MGIVEEEVDESIYWMELLVEGGINQLKDAHHLITEANELLGIVISSIKTARKTENKCMGNFLMGMFLSALVIPHFAFRIPH